MKAYISYAIFWGILLATPSSGYSQTKPDAPAVSGIFINRNPVEEPVYLICFSNRNNASKTVFVIEGYIIGDRKFNAKREPLAAYIVVVGVVMRKEGEK